LVDTKPDSPIEWNEVQEAPKPLPDVPDEAWRKRSVEQDGPSTSSGTAERDWVPDQVRGSGAVTASFGYCKWGGGTNCVVDGDTFYINGDKVRIAGIDAPETHDNRCESELALGNQATEKLHALLNSGAVTMTSIDRDRDVYGRLLRNVSVNGQDVGGTMVSAGVAREYGSGRRPWC
jgi:endonuclease YncB( thermonuclease family)